MPIHREVYQHTVLLKKLDAAGGTSQKIPQQKQHNSADATIRWLVYRKEDVS